MLPCARITSIRFKGTVSVERFEASFGAFNTPSECDEYKPRNRPRGGADYGAACGPTFSKRCNRALLVVYSSGGCAPGRSRAATP